VQLADASLTRKFAEEVDEEARLRSQFASLPRKTDGAANLLGAARRG
jgi:hypothetical protein